MTGSESVPTPAPIEMEVSSLLPSLDAKDEVPPSTPSSTSTDPSNSNGDELPSDEEKDDANKSIHGIDDAGRQEGDPNKEGSSSQQSTEEVPWDEIQKPEVEETKESKIADESQQSQSQSTAETGSLETHGKDAGTNTHDETAPEEEIVEDPSQSSAKSKSDPGSDSKESADNEETVQEGPTNKEEIVDEASQSDPLLKSETDIPEDANVDFNENTESIEEKGVILHVETAATVDDNQTNDGDLQDTIPARKITPKTVGISFAQAFSTTPLPPMQTLSPTSISKKPSLISPVSISSPQEGEDTSTATPTSHSALSASRNKKASALISKYREIVAHEALPGDSVPLRSVSRKSNNFTTVSPGTAKVLLKKAEETSIELNSLPALNSVRDKFEKSSRKSTGSFEFGESFRQKLRHEQLSEKEKEEEAKVSMRGFNEKILNNGKTATGEIDTSNLPKSFTFDMTSGTAFVPNDGVCRVDYNNADFRSKVFVVHKTRGMLLLQDKHASSSKSSRKKGSSRKKSTVPGGKINEEEFLAASKESGSAYVQLQIAARDAAARLVFELTGLDIRQQADRLKPAVLTMTPSMNTERGYQYLRNENEENLYYFLQVDEEDFQRLRGAEGEDTSSTKFTRPSADPGESSVPAKLKRPSEDPGDDPLALKISSNYSGFEFVQDPVVARKVLKKDGNDAAIALSMIMSAAAQEMNGNSPTSSKENAAKGPHARATEYPTKSMFDEELDEGVKKDGKIRTVGIAEYSEGNDEKKVRTKASGDNAEDSTGVGCCCSFWSF